MVIFHCYVSSSEGRGYPEPSWTCIVDLCFVLNPFPHCQACGHQEADEYLLQLGLPVRLAEQLWTESCREPKPQDFFLRVAGRTYHIMCFCSFQDCEGCQGWFHGNKYDLHRHIIILITAHVLLKRGHWQRSSFRVGEVRDVVAHLTSKCYRTFGQTPLNTFNEGNAK